MVALRWQAILLAILRFICRVVPGIRQGREQGSPGNVSQAWQFRRVPAKTKSANLIESIVIDARVLGVEMHDPLTEIAQAASGVDELKHQVRGIEIETEKATGNLAKHAVPDCRRDRQVLPPRPFIFGEKHRAILDADLHILLFSVANDIGPGGAEQRPVVVDRLGPVAANKGVDDVDTEFRRCIDHLVKVLDHRLATFGVGVERIGIIPQSGDLPCR